MGECTPSSQIEVDPEKLIYWIEVCGGTFDKIDNYDNAYKGNDINATNEGYTWWGSGKIWRCTDRLPTCDENQYYVYNLSTQAQMKEIATCGM